jgi:hypothetical protein
MTVGLFPSHMFAMVIDRRYKELLVDFRASIPKGFNLLSTHLL